MLVVTAALVVAVVLVVTAGPVVVIFGNALTEVQAIMPAFLFSPAEVTVLSVMVVRVWRWMEVRP